MSNGQHGYCRKEKEIAEVHTKVRRMEKILLDGNGGEPLVVSVPKLSQSVDTLNGHCEGLQKGMSGFLKYQQEQEGKSEGIAEMKKRTRWMIGILVMIIVCLIGSIITLIIMAGGVANG